MAIKRLTYFFYTELKETTLNTLDINGASIPLDVFMFSTDFPFYFDEDLALVRPIDQANKDKDVYLKSQLNPNEWLLGVAINGNVVFDGISKNQLGPNNILYSSLEYGVIKTEINQGKGIIYLNPSIFQLGVLDTIEIVAIRSKVWTPWIYFGNIPQRQVLVNNNLGRNDVKGMGGIPESLTPAQAAQFRYFVDFNLSTDFTPILIPFPSAFLIGTPIGGVGSTFSKAFFMADILDSDGSIAFRSNTNFTISEISLSESIAGGGFSVPIFSIPRNDNYRTINYRRLFYNTETFSSNKVIKNTSYYIIFDIKEKFNNFYISFSDIFNLLIKEYVDFENTDFRIFTVYKNLGTQLSSERLNDSDKISIIISNIVGQGDEKSSLKSTISLVENSINNDRKKDLSNGVIKDYSIIVISDMNFLETDYTISDNVKIHGAYVREQGEDLEKGKDIFGGITTLNQFKGAGVYGFEFLQSLSRVNGKTLVESDLYSSDEKIDSLKIKNQCKVLLKKINETSLSDIDRDGKVTLIDRIYSIYDNYNPSVETIDDSFFGDRSVEMRFWRNNCPIGQLYSFYGKISKKIDLGSGNYLLQVLIVSIGEDGEAIIEDPDNIIQVFYEAGATSNISGLTQDSDFLDEIFEFQGRLFYPPYWNGIGDGIQIANGINLNKNTELTAWYRIRNTTSSQLLNFINDENLSEEPIIVIRSNIENNVSETDAHGQGQITNLFLDPQTTISFFSISQYAEKVKDFIILISNNEAENQQKEYQISQQGDDNTVSIFETNNSQNINFENININISLEDNKSIYGEFEYKISYSLNGDSTLYELAKFWSAAAFISGGKEGELSIDLSLPKKFNPKISWKSSESDYLNNRLFDIVFPYPTHDDDSQGKRYFFKWDKDSWNIKIEKNNKALTYFVTDNIPTITDETEDSLFKGNSAIISTDGYLVLKEQINPKKDVLLVTFTNKSAGQILLKTGSNLWLSLESRPDKSITAPTISNVRVNRLSNENIERVDFNYRNDGLGVDRDHFIAPAWGYVMLAGDRGWVLDVPEEDFRAESSFGTRVQGFLTSPFPYFDAFTTNIDDKIIKASSPSNLPVIDIVYGNLVSSSTQPYMDVRTVGFTPSPPDVLSQVTTAYDEEMGRMTIIFKKGDFFNSKFSYLNFKDRDTTEDSLYWERRSHRKELPVYGGITTIEELSFNEVGDGIEFDIQKPGQILVALRLEATLNEDVDDITQPLELLGFIDGSFKSLGFQEFSGYRTSLWIPLTNVGDISVGTRQIPDVNNIQKLKLRKPDSLSDVGVIQKLEGYYINSYFSGEGPSVTQFDNGMYCLFFSNDDGNQIQGVISMDSGQRWVRPAVDEKDSDYGVPIPILTGFRNPLLMNDFINERMHVFLYNYIDSTIDFISIPFYGFLRVSQGIDESAETNEGNTSSNQEKSIDDKLSEDSVGSWQDIFSQKLSYPVLFDATRFFSAIMVKNGIIFVANISTEGNLRIVYTLQSGSNSFQSNSWSDLQVDLFHPNSSLSQVISAEDVVSMSLSYDNGGDNLYLFFVTTDNRLILFEVPDLILRVEVEDIEESELQKELNRIRPSLVIGENDPQNPNLIVNSFIEGAFENQIIQPLWTNEGECYIWYYSDGKTKCIRSITQGLSWENYDNG